MLKFTHDQEQLIINERRAFNARQNQIGEMITANSAFLGNAAPLHKDAWGRWDAEAVEIQRDVLAVFNSLSSLSKTVPIGVLVNYFQRVTDSGAAGVSLDGQGGKVADAPLIDYVGTPIPIIDSYYKFGWRQMEAERQAGFTGLDMSAQNNAVRKVAEQLEDMAINGSSLVDVGGAKIYGLRNHPKRNTTTHGLTLQSATGAQWLAAVTANIKLLISDNFYTPATVYLNYADWFYASNTEFTAGYPKTILQRLKEIEGIAEIVPASKIPANEIISLAKRRDVVEILNAMPIVTRPQFRANPEDPYVFKVMAAAAPQFKYDSKDQCGIAQSTTA